MTETVKQAIAKAAVEVAEAMTLAINEEDRRQDMGAVTRMQQKKHTANWRLSLRQPIFDWSVRDKRIEMYSIEMVVSNIFLTKNYGIIDTEKYQIWKTGLQFIQMLMGTEKEACQSLNGIFETLAKKLKHQHNGTILSLQDCKLVRQCVKTAEESIDHLRLYATELDVKKRIKG